MNKKRVCVVVDCFVEESAWREWRLVLYRTMFLAVYIRDLVA